MNGPPGVEAPPRSRGTLLGGKVAYSQFRAGYRTGIEPVLMAAAVPASAGETVLEAGCGAGAGLLCLLHRVPGACGVGVELDGPLAALARENGAANGACMEVRAADVLAGPLPRCDHAMANPPWHAGGTLPADAGRRLALHGDGLRWIGPLATAARATVTLALPGAAGEAAAAAMLAAGLGDVVLFPLRPRAGAAAKIVLLQGRRGTGGARTAEGLVLHGEGGGFTAAAEAVLREAAGLELGAGR